MIQPTSLTALADLVGAGHACRQERELLKLWLEHPTEGLTDREAEHYSGIRSNTVSARRNGLITRWYIEKVPLQFHSHARQCTVTGRTVNAWRILEGHGNQLRFGF